jgi:LacI family transcriptional regulator, repressor for deo operon, udp, cdd, tsx, nupC, and nupG
MSSLAEVARRAGVSKATASRALSGAAHVSPAARERVSTAASDLGYVVSSTAASLVTGRTKNVGVITPFINRWFFAEVLDGVETALRQAGFDLLLYNLGDGSGRARFFELLPLRKRVDAVVVASLVLDEPELAALSGLGYPVGLLGTAHGGFLSTRIDDVAGARTAVEHLLSLGHERIGLISGDTDDPLRFTPPLHRLHGYRQALRAAGVQSDPDLEVLGYFTIAGGSEACERMLALPERPTAIFAESDEMAYGAIRALRRHRLRVPDDVALIGFDDHVTAEVMDLSTVRQPVAAQAVDIATRLLATLAGTNGEAGGDVVLPTELVVRGSTDPSRSVY